jgi:hypothetical protein
MAEARAVPHSNSRIYVSPTWQRIGLILAAILFCTLAYIYHDVGGAFRSRRLIFDAFAALSVLAVLDVLTTRLVLTQTSLWFRRHFRRRSFSRHAISKASWEGGAPVSVLVESVGWVHLPDVGSARSLVQVLDHWIQTSEATPVAPAATSDTTKRASPDGNFDVRTSAWEMFNTHWVHWPKLLDTRTNEVLFAPNDNWSVDPPTPAWIGPSLLRLVMRKYPGNHEPAQLEVLVDCEARSFELSSGGKGDLSELEARMDSALSWKSR